MAAKWDVNSLSDVCEFRAGSVFKPVFQGKTFGKYPFVKVSDMNLSANAVRIQDANNWISEDDLKELRAKLLPSGTVIFAKIGEALRQNRLRQVAREIVVDNNMMGAVPNIKYVEPKFFYYALSKFDFSEIAQGTALPYLTVSTLSKLTIDTPPLPEQRAIAHILGTLDDKIELNRRMNETLEAMARALFKSWFVDFDPVHAKAEGRDTGLPKPLADLFPDSFQDSELGKIPKGWKVGKLGDVADHPRRTIEAKKIDFDMPYIALEHMPRRSIALSDWGVAAGLESNKFEFKKGEILFGKLRPYFHKVGVAPLDGVCSTDIVVIAPKTESWFGFVLAHVSNDAFVEYTNAGSTGTKMPRTNWRDMASYPIVVPSKPVAEAFSRQMHPAVDKIIAGIHESRTLAKMRDIILPKLICGDLRLKNI
jgi:type I restriction enzyme, S subunit